MLPLLEVINILSGPLGLNHFLRLISEYVPILISYFKILWRCSKAFTLHYTYFVQVQISDSAVDLWLCLVLVDLSLRGRSSGNLTHI